MARGDIVIRLESRPIYYKNKKALFHKWSDYSRVIEPSILRGGHGGGLISRTVAIIETEDGKIHQVLPNEIWFADPGYIDRVWKEQETRSLNCEEGVYKDDD